MSDGGRSIQPKGRPGLSETRPLLTAATPAQAGSAVHSSVEPVVPSHDRIGIPGQDLLELHLGDALAVAAGISDVDPAYALDDLRVDRALEARLQAVRAAGEVDPRPRVGRHLGQHLVDVGEGRLGIGGELLAALGDAQDLAGQSQGGGRVGEAAVDQQIGDAGLLLHPVGQRDVGVADAAEVEDQVGLDLEDDLEVGGVAAAG